MMTGRAAFISANQRDRHAPVVGRSLPARSCVACERRRVRHADAARFIALRSGAADYPRWAGFYFGGQIGHSSAEMNFAGATESLIAFILRTTALENEQHPSNGACSARPSQQRASYGGVHRLQHPVGRRHHRPRPQLQSRQFFANAPVTPITRVVAAGGNAYFVNINGDASMRDHRLRIGAAARRLGHRQLHALCLTALACAVGRGAIAWRSIATAPGIRSSTDDPPLPSRGPNDRPSSLTRARKNALIYGWAVGGGMDFMVMPNVFVRAESSTCVHQVQGIRCHAYGARRRWPQVLSAQRPGGDQRRHIATGPRAEVA